MTKITKKEIKNRFKLINGAYWCNKHNFKNCVICFEQAPGVVGEKTGGNW
jgi:hypothetical protein